MNSKYTFTLEQTETQLDATYKSSNISEKPVTITHGAVGNISDMIVSTSQSKYFYITKLVITNGEDSIKTKKVEDK